MTSNDTSSIPAYIHRLRTSCDLSIVVIKSQLRHHLDAHRELCDDWYVYDRLIGVSKSQFQPHPDAYIIPMSSTRPDPSGRKIALFQSKELPQSCGFLAIAREVRHMIYSDLIRSGNVAILQVCQQVHDEAKALLHKQGIFRLNLFDEGGSQQLKAQNLPQVPSIPIPNCYVNIALDSVTHIGQPSPQPLELYPRFYTLDPGYGDCHITLLARLDRLPTTPLVELIKGFATFRLVTLRIHSTGNLHPMDRRNQTIVEPLHTRYLQSLTSELSQALGDPNWKFDVSLGSRDNRPAYLPKFKYASPFPNAQYLEFHPLKKQGVVGGICR